MIAPERLRLIDGTTPGAGEVHLMRRRVGGVWQYRRLTEQEVEDFDILGRAL